MPFTLRMGVPEMEAFWNDLTKRRQQGKLGKEEEKFFKKLVKALNFLGQNPRYNSLASHEITDLSQNNLLQPNHGILFLRFVHNFLKSIVGDNVQAVHGMDASAFTVRQAQARPMDCSMRILAFAARSGIIV